MLKIPLNIIEFVQHPAVLNDRSHSPAQLTILRSLYGLPLSPHEREVYFEGTGKEYVAEEKRELTLVTGRRSGKTSRVAAPVAIYEACRDHGLSRNEQAFVLLMSRTLRQARLAFHFIEEYIRNSEALSQYVVDSTEDEIRLENGVVIACVAHTHDSVRGRTVIAAVLDEIAFWSRGPKSGDSVEQMLDALRPAMITVSRAKIIKLSTPFGKQGVLWEDFNRRLQLDFPVWQLSTAKMNPKIDPAELDVALRRDEEKFRREFQAEFTDSIEGWVPPTLLEPCVVKGRSEFPFQPGMQHIAALDPASRKNDFALAILHKRPDGIIVVDKVRRWTGTKDVPLAFESVLGEVKSILDLYEINSACGDQYYCDAISEHLLKLGISYNIISFGAQTRASLFANLKHLLAQRRIELPDHPELFRQFYNLRQEQTERGQIDVRPAPGTNDDLAVAVGLGTSELCKCVREVRPTPFEIVDNTSAIFIPGSCSYEAVCVNHPKCIDEDSCFGFRNSFAS